MTETSLKQYLTVSGWAAILATIVKFSVSIIEHNKNLIEMNIDAEFHTQMIATYVFGFGIELPLTLTLACLCLMAARMMTYETQTLNSIFE